MYPYHENETGAFQELARTDDVKFGQLSYLMIKPGASRGNHYHTHKEEWFCCLHGRCEMRMEHIKTKEKRTVLLEDTNRNFVKVHPYENHVIVNIDKERNAELLIIINKEYHPETADTYRPGKEPSERPSA